MKYMITGRNIKITPIDDDDTRTAHRRRSEANRRERDAEGRFVGRGAKGSAGTGGKFQRFLVLAKPI